MSIKRIRWRWIGATFAALAVVVSLVACGSLGQKHFEGSVAQVTDQCMSLGMHETASVSINTSGEFEYMTDGRTGEQLKNELCMFEGDYFLICYFDHDVAEEDIPTFIERVNITGEVNGDFMLNPTTLTVDHVTIVRP